MNWYLKSRELIVKDKLDGVLGNASGDSPRMRVGSSVNFLGDPEPADAIIVPPSVIKPDISNVLREQWEDACKAMSEADAIWFNGYSFPESDSFMRYFLASALTGNARIRQLAVIDPDIEVKKRSLRILHAPRLREVFQFLPTAWRLVNFEGLAAGKYRFGTCSFQQRQHGV
jgi:hypothetical protein